MIFEFRQTFLIKKYGVPEAREVSRNLPGARGFVFPKYGPEASHGDPTHDQKSGFQNSGFVLYMPAGALFFLKKFIFVYMEPLGAVPELPQTLPKLPQGLPGLAQRLPRPRAPSEGVPEASFLRPLRTKPWSGTRRRIQRIQRIRRIGPMNCGSDPPFHARRGPG